MQAMKHSVANVPSQQAVKLEVLGPFVSLSNVAVDCTGIQSMESYMMIHMMM